jgi:arsenite methyltransferase
LFNKPTPKGVVAKLAGYSDEELANLPPEAVTNSFGCGNPLAFSAVKAGDTVLDLGSGAGIDVLLAARKVGPSGKVIGIDMTDTMIAKARENVKIAKVNNVEIRKGIIEGMPVDDNSIDWVISNCVINLSPEKHRVFHEIYRVLKPGGTMLVSDIVAEQLPQEITANPDLYSSCLAGAISEADYISGLQQAGLGDIRVLARLIYDENQLRAFIGSELSENKCCCFENKIATWIKQLLGQVWTSKFAPINVIMSSKCSILVISIGIKKFSLGQS